MTRDTDTDTSDRVGLGAMLFALLVTAGTLAALAWAEWKRERTS